MNRSTISLLCLFPLLFVSLARATGAQTRAQDFAMQQDFRGDPPDLDPVLTDILTQVLPNGAYLGSGANFPGVTLPPSIVTMLAVCRTGGFVTSGSPRCVTLWSSCLVRLTFDDGSDYVYERFAALRRCTDGTIESLDRQQQIADAGPPGNVDDSRIGWTYEDTFSQPRRGQRVITPAASSWSFAASPVRPVVETDDFEFVAGPGGTLDLRQNAAAGGPLFVTTTPALLHCDTILLDPGVTLADLFQPPPIVLPGTFRTDVECAVPALRSLDVAPATATVLLHNTGNAPEQFAVSWSDPLGFAAPGAQLVPLAPGEIQVLDVPLAVPPATQRGEVSPLSVQVVATSDPTVTRQSECQLVFDHAGVFRFGDGTAGCLGPHAIDIDGPVIAGGPAAQISCDAVQPGAIGIWLFGTPLGNYEGLLAPAVGAELYVDPFSPALVTQLAVAAPSGQFLTSLQWPYLLQLRGLGLTTQMLTLGDAGCVLQTFPLTSSPALSFVIQ